MNSFEGTEVNDRVLKGEDPPYHLAVGDIVSLGLSKSGSCRFGKMRLRLEHHHISWDSITEASSSGEYVEHEDQKGASILAPYKSVDAGNETQPHTGEFFVIRRVAAWLEMQISYYDTNPPPGGMGRFVGETLEDFLHLR